MDLEIIGKQMLEALAIRGQLAAMQTNLTALQGEATKASGDIQKSQEAKASTIEAREQAMNAWDEAIIDAEDAQEQIIKVIAERKSAELVVGQAEEEVDKYSDAILSQLDEVTQQFQDGKLAIEAEMDKILKKLEVLKKDLETRQAELKAVGVELNLIGTAPRPKVTTL